MFLSNKDDDLSQKNVIGQIKKEIFSVLKEAGFSEFTTRHAWRYKDETIDVIEFQFFDKDLAYQLGVTNLSFAINLGRYFNWCPEDGPEKLLYQKKDTLTPDVTICPARKPLTRTITQKIDNKHVWLIDKKGNNLSTVFENIQHEIQNTALPWFEGLNNFDHWEQTLLQQEQTNNFFGFGSLDSPSRNMLLGFTKFKKQEWSKAIHYFELALNSGAIHFLRDNILSHIEKAKSNIT